MFGKEPKDTLPIKGVQDIQPTDITKALAIGGKGGKTVNFRIHAYTGIVDGKREVLDEVLIDSMVEQIARALKANSSSYNPIPDEITIGKVNTPKPTQQEPEQQIIESWEPRYTLEQVALNEKVRQQIRTAISAVKYQKKLTDEWGLSEHFSGNRAIILNFYGKAGTGKSMTAEAVAKALGKRVYRISYAELESKYVGETPKNIRRAFELAAKDDAVLIFDEADSFLGKRLTSVTQSADYGVNITRSVLLMELEKFTGVVVFTTNLISNYDEAFKRRILLNVYFELPDQQAREAIWRLHLGPKVPLGDVTPGSLAERYEGISGADIKDMVFYAALYTLEQGKEIIDFSAFQHTYSMIQERYKDRDKERGFKVVSTETITEEQYQQETGRDSHA